MLSVTIAGRVSKGAKLTKAGQSDVCNFRVSVGRGDDVQIVGCSLWGKRALSLAEHLVQGVPVTVSGGLSLETHDGSTYLTVRSVQDIAILDTVDNVRANRERYRARRQEKRRQAEMPLRQPRGRRNPIAEGGGPDGDQVIEGPWHDD